MKHFQIYDQVNLSGKELEIIQILPEDYLCIPLDGGVPERFSKDLFSNAEIISSLFGEIKSLSSTEKYKRIMENAKDRWASHISRVGRKKSTSKKSSAVNINIKI